MRQFSKLLAIQKSFTLFFSELAFACTLGLNDSLSLKRKNECALGSFSRFCGA